MKFSLFRSIRHKLLREGKPLRYLSYAVGEVALIIVGILLAIEISDYNDEQTHMAEQRELMVRLADAEGLKRK